MPTVTVRALASRSMPSGAGYDAGNLANLRLRRRCGAVEGPGSVEHRPQALDRGGNRLGRAREAQPQITFAHRPEGAAGRQTDFGLGQQLLGEGDAVRYPVD